MPDDRWMDVAHRIILPQKNLIFMLKSPYYFPIPTLQFVKNQNISASVARPKSKSQPYDTWALHVMPFWNCILVLKKCSTLMQAYILCKLEYCENMNLFYKLPCWKQTVYVYDWDTSQLLINCSITLLKKKFVQHVKRLI